MMLLIRVTKKTHPIGYFDKAQNLWVETFSTGASFQWVQQGDEILMVNLSKEGKTIHRNRWTKPENGIFQIIEERSEDKGETWKIKSRTNVESRKGRKQ